MPEKKESNGKVIIDVELYNQLHDFREKTLQNKSFKVKSNYYNNSQTYVISENISEEIFDMNKKLNEQLIQLSDDNQKLKREYDEIIDKFYKMSIIDFYKWKKKKN